jgi:hypothetical protein
VFEQHDLGRNEGLSEDEAVQTKSTSSASVVYGKKSWNSGIVWDEIWHVVNSQFEKSRSDRSDGMEAESRWETTEK